MNGLSQPGQGPGHHAQARAQAKRFQRLSVTGQSERQVMPTWAAFYTVAGVRLGGACGCGQCGWGARRFRKIYRPDASLSIKVCEPV